jgi:pimeloyl-ACP methyl ester carboxylesterase
VSKTGAVDPTLEKFWWFSGALNSAAMRWMLPAAVNRASDEKYAHVQELRELEPCWDSLRMPVTVVQGDADAIVDTANFTYLRRKLPDSQNTFIRLPGVGHLVTKERPDLVRELLLATVNSLKKQ